MVVNIIPLLKKEGTHRHVSCPSINRGKASIHYEESGSRVLSRGWQSPWMYENRIVFDASV